MYLASVGNCLLLVILLKKAVHHTFHNLLILLSIYDIVSSYWKPVSVTNYRMSVIFQVYLLSSFLLFSLPKFLTNSNFLITFLPFLILPVAHIAMVNKNNIFQREKQLRNFQIQIGSIFSAVALSIERYIAVVHPFVKYRYALLNLSSVWARAVRAFDLIPPIHPPH